MFASINSAVSSSSVAFFLRLRLFFVPSCAAASATAAIAAASSSIATGSWAGATDAFSSLVVSSAAFGFCIACPRIVSTSPMLGFFFFASAIASSSGRATGLISSTEGTAITGAGSCSFGSGLRASMARTVLFCLWLFCFNCSCSLPTVATTVSLFIPWVSTFFTVLVPRVRTRRSAFASSLACTSRARLSA